VHGIKPARDEVRAWQVAQGLLGWNSNCVTRSRRKASGQASHPLAGGFNTAGTTVVVYPEQQIYDASRASSGAWDPQGLQKT
jgi:hypothetical protein